MTLTAIYPVVHHLDAATTADQMHLAIEAGATGVFLIDHEGRDKELYKLARGLRKTLPIGFRMGLNFLSWDNHRAYDHAVAAAADMLWLDAPGIRDGELRTEARRLVTLTEAEPKVEIFASVAFKHQPHDEDPVGSVEAALGVNWVPVTSGPKTGHAPSIAKIKELSNNGKTVLGVASGMTPENVSWYVPYVSHILVATGVCSDFHHFDYERLRAFIGAVRRAEAC